jgi:hypothetical protein
MGRIKEIMDLKLYQETKASGGVTIARLTPDMAVVSTRKFNPANGQEMDPSFEQFSIKELKSQRESSAKALAAIDELIADCEAAQIVGAPK